MDYSEWRDNASDAEIRDVIDKFHAIYYGPHKIEIGPNMEYGSNMPVTRWMGLHVQKCPFDLFIYQEIIFYTCPDLIIECGSASGGSAVFLGDMLNTCGLVNSRVISIDKQAPGPEVTHPLVTFIESDVLDKNLIDNLRDLSKGLKVIVVLDDDHERDHVLTELRVYGEFVTPGYYMIVEDTNVHGHPVSIKHPPGPMEAVEQFLKESNEFKSDRTCEKFLLTFNPKGYLVKQYVEQETS